MMVSCLGASPGHSGSVRFFTILLQIRHGGVPSAAVIAHDGKWLRLHFPYGQSCQYNNPDCKKQFDEKKPDNRS